MDELFSISDHVIVCGYGGTGAFAAMDLATEGMPIVVVDRATERVSLARQDGHLAVLGDVLDPEVLKEAGIERARGVILVLPSESDNLFATMTAREMNPDVFLIARNTSGHARDKFLRAGADRVVNPFEQTGRLIGSEIMRPALMDLMRIFTAAPESGDEVRVREVTLAEGCPLVGKSLREADVRARLNVLVIAMRKGDSATRFNPDPERPLEAGDVLVCMGPMGALRELRDVARGAPA